ncbi:MAG: methyltransferase domain-containing protein, partial [Kofleriaceae bacterium]
PNLAPSLIVYSFLPIIGQPLDPPTAVTGAIALGILADDTIHGFKTWQAHRRAPGADAASAVRGMLSEVGKPMVLSSVIVAVGFSIMLVSRYGTLVWTGVMMIIVTTTALVWELVCTPSMLRLLKKPVAPKVEPAELALTTSFHEARADHGSKLADYSDAELEHMRTSDLYALLGDGKAVLRNGGNDGSRRMVEELRLAGAARVLVVGSEAARRDLAELLADAVVERVDEATISKLTFEDAVFDAVILEAIASYHDAPRCFAEALRVLKPGGRVGLHDWCWMEQPNAELEVATCVIACGKDVGTAKFFTKDDWKQTLVSSGFEVGFIEHYPSKYLSVSTLRDDQGLLAALTITGRALARTAVRRRLLRAKRFLSHHDIELGYAIAVGTKPR